MLELLITFARSFKSNYSDSFGTYLIQFRDSFAV